MATKRYWWPSVVWGNFNRSIAMVSHGSKAGVLKVIDIDPQGSMESSKGSMNSQEVERGSVNVYWGSKRPFNPPVLNSR